MIRILLPTLSRALPRQLQFELGRVSVRLACEGRYQLGGSKPACEGRATARSSGSFVNAGWLNPDQSTNSGRCRGILAPN